MKAIACDSSSIISLSENCLLWILRKFDTEFWIPPYVKKEIMDYPITTKKYGFEAMKNGIEMGKSLKVVETDKKLRDRIIEISNKVLLADGRPLKVIHYGEADALALAISKNLKALLVDEKNTRLVIENPYLLAKIIEKRINKRVEVNEEAKKEMEKITKGIKVIRSSELAAIAVKRGIIDWPYPKKELLKNLLYALKFSGCAISKEEIEEISSNI